MKYLLMIFNNPDAPWSDSDDDVRGLRELMTIDDELADSGELVSSAALHGPGPAGAKTVRAHGGLPAVTDGPFSESKEHLAGYLAVECASVDRAVEIAGRISAAVNFPVEVRPIIDKDELRHYLADS